MGVDCRLSLPHTVRIHDVKDVIGALCGLKMEMDGIPSAHCDAITAETLSGSMLATCVSIRWKELTGESREWLFHFEGDAPLFGRTILPRAAARNIAICHGLAKFFGGHVDYNDSDSVDCNFKKRANPLNAASDGEAWRKLQNSKMAVKPLTEAAISKFERWAAYKATGEWK